MEKRGQFYLIAAIIIIIVIVSLSSVTNYIERRKEPAKFYDLSEELSEEGARVVDYGIYNEENITSLMSNFLDNYFVNYTTEKEEEVVFVYGNENNITVMTYTNISTGEIAINYGTTSMNIRGAGRYQANRTTFTPGHEENKITVTILENNYEFTLKEGENFFFIITRTSGEERYVITPEGD